ncbi:unnamed protein product [Amoebophrya sp. A120]|nr:unnamed protein product [Amoebophrya sp. A120]|eukprot:GSA120T00023520001.1
MTATAGSTAAHSVAEQAAKRTTAAAAISGAKPTYSKPVTEFWQKHLTEQSRDGWYKKAIDYWDQQEASVNGVLGGFGHTSAQDLRESKRLLQILKGRKDLSMEFNTVLDCGAGIGRISNGLLLQEFKAVDLLEPCQKLFNQAKKENAEKIRFFFQKSLQNFQFSVEEIDGASCGGTGVTTLSSAATTSATSPSASATSGMNNSTSTSSSTAAPPAAAALGINDKIRELSSTSLQYDCIWNQWVLLYLTDDDLITYLQKCQRQLTKPGGFMFVKENVLLPPAGSVDRSHPAWTKYEKGMEIDEDDNGVTRSDDRYRELFEKAGLELICAVKQANWPKDLYPIYMYVLR